MITLSYCVGRLSPNCSHRTHHCCFPLHISTVPCNVLFSPTAATSSVSLRRKANKQSKPSLASTVATSIPLLAPWTSTKQQAQLPGERLIPSPPSLLLWPLRMLPFLLLLCIEIPCACKHLKKRRASSITAQSTSTSLPLLLLPGEIDSKYELGFPVLKSQICATVVRSSGKNGGSSRHKTKQNKASIGVTKQRKI